LGEVAPQTAAVLTLEGTQGVDLAVEADLLLLHVPEQGGPLALGLGVEVLRAGAGLLLELLGAGLGLRLEALGLVAGGADDLLGLLLGLGDDLVGVAGGQLEEPQRGGGGLGRG